MKNIELEIRAEVPIRQYDAVLARLKRHGKFKNKTKRCSIMFFGKVHGDQFDIRVRVTNGKAEIVIKKGGWHAEDRMEFSQPIDKSEMVGLARVFSLLDFVTKVGERETFNFDFGKGTVVSLVKAGRLAYLEVERMTSARHLLKDKADVLSILNGLDFKPLDKAGYEGLCHRLTRHVDWLFHGKPADLRRLAKILHSY